MKRLTCVNNEWCITSSVCVMPVFHVITGHHFPNHYANQHPVRQLVVRCIGIPLVSIFRNYPLPGRCPNVLHASNPTCKPMRNKHETGYFSRALSTSNQWNSENPSLRQSPPKNNNLLLRDLVALVTPCFRKNKKSKQKISTSPVTAMIANPCLTVRYLGAIGTRRRYDTWKKGIQARKQRSNKMIVTYCSLSSNTFPCVVKKTLAHPIAKILHSAWGLPCKNLQLNSASAKTCTSFPSGWTLSFAYLALGRIERTPSTRFGRANVLKKHPGTAKCVVDETMLLVYASLCYRFSPFKHLGLRWFGGSIDSFELRLSWPTQNRNNGDAHDSFADQNVHGSRV